MSSGSESGYPSRGKIVSTTVFESGPPAHVSQPEVVSTTQTEEWTTKKKTDTLVTKQIETRVKREIVVTEDGEIIEDSGPTVTTDTTENSRTEENENVEHKTSGLGDPGPGWVLVPGSKVISETKKNKSTNHETREEKTDTEVTEEIGGLTRQEIDRALKQRETAALLARTDSCSTADSPNHNTVLQSSQTRQIVDTEVVDETADIRAGAVVNRKKTTTSNREEFYDEQNPDGVKQYLSGPTAESEPIITSPNSTAPRKPKRKHHYQSSIKIESVPSSPTPNPIINSPNSTGPRQNRNYHHTKFEFEPTSILRNPIITSPTSTAPRKPKHTPQSPLIESVPSSSLLLGHHSPESQLDSRNNQGDTRETDTGTPTSTNTSQWVENHFGSQDFIDSGIVSDQHTARTDSSPTTATSPANECIIPIDFSESESVRRVHYSKRQQLPEEINKTKHTPSPSSEPEMLRFAVNGDGGGQRRQSSSSSSSLPKKQYYLGEDPGIGQRFTGMSHNDAPRNGYSNSGSTTYNTNSLSRPIKSRIEVPSAKFATMGRDSHLHSNIDVNPRSSNGHHRTTQHYPIKTGQYVKRDYYPTRASTMGRNGSPSYYSTQIDTESPPSVTDIIHSLRSKEYLDKESAAVSIRDDDSVFDHRHGQTLFRPYIPTNKRPSNKQHVVKISIKSGDESDCSSPIHSPRGNSRTSNRRPSFEYQSQPTSRLSSGDYERSHNDSIVKNAISNLLKNRLNSNESSGSPNSSTYSSLQRNPTAGYYNGSSNLKSKTYLTASSPNVNRIEVEPPPLSKPQHQSRYTMFNGNRSKSINNLSRGNDHYQHAQYNTDYSDRSHSPDYQYSTYSPNGVTRMNINGDSKNSRHHFMQKLLDNKNGYHRENTPIKQSQRHAPVQPRWSNGSHESQRAYSPSTGSPPSSPSYTNRIKLPSPIPPSRLSTSPPRSPRSPPPPLTRPFSPSQYYHQNERSHNNNSYGPPDYDISSRYRSVRSTSTPHHYHARSPSPASYRRRPPSPVLPKPSSIGDDVASNASGQSHSTNAGSRESDESLMNGQIKSTSKRKVTTTTLKKREVESPVSDYYYDTITNGSLPRDKLGKSVIRVRDYNGR